MFLLLPCGFWRSDAGHQFGHRCLYIVSHLAKPESSYFNRIDWKNKLLSGFAQYEWTSDNWECTLGRKGHSLKPSVPCKILFDSTSPFDFILRHSSVNNSEKNVLVYVLFVSQITLWDTSHSKLCNILYRIEKEITVNRPCLSHPLAQLPFAREGTTACDVSGFDVFFPHLPNKLTGTSFFIVFHFFVLCSASDTSASTLN